jgi:hypothetical protein
MSYGDDITASDGLEPEEDDDFASADYDEDDEFGSEDDEEWDEEEEPSELS